MTVKEEEAKLIDAARQQTRDLLGDSEHFGVVADWQHESEVVNGEGAEQTVVVTVVITYRAGMLPNA